MYVVCMLLSEQAFLSYAFVNNCKVINHVVAIVSTLYVLSRK